MSKYNLQEDTDALRIHSMVGGGQVGWGYNFLKADFKSLVPLPALKLMTVHNILKLTPERLYEFGFWVKGSWGNSSLPIVLLISSVQ